MIKILCALGMVGVLTLSLACSSAPDVDNAGESTTDTDEALSIGGGSQGGAGLVTCFEIHCPVGASDGCLNPCLRAGGKTDLCIKECHCEKKQVECKKPKVAM